MIAVISLPFVSLHGFNYGFNYGYWPQTYFSPYYSGVKFVSGYAHPPYFGLFNRFNSYFVPPIIYPAVHYNYAPITPIIYYKSLFSPILHHGFGGYKISGPGLPTHPGYRPPTMWKRIWPPTDSNKSETEDTSNKPEPRSEDSATEKP